MKHGNLDLWISTVTPENYLNQFQFCLSQFRLKGHEQTSLLELNSKYVFSLNLRNSIDRGKA